MKPIIEVKNLSKKYRIGERQRYLSLRDSVGSLSSGKNTEGSASEKKTEFWALDDVSFDIQAGESVGIIGRNGAGKSTLLKILSRITPPTKGNVILRGRMASLLEVGTGFHPELTGRENVYFNGSILGLKKAEIQAKFDEIVDFSGVEQFIDTPLKHYSSGMQLRLAFSVAAHLEPEILVIDEVLAVGDAEFQKKCLGKMDEVSKGGRTVLFVSHNISMLEKLCQRRIVLNNGRIQKDGNMLESLHFYTNLLEKKKLDSRLPLSIDFNLILENLEIKLQKESTSIFLIFKFKNKPKILDFCLIINSLSGVRISIIDLRPKITTVQYSEYEATWKIETAKLNLVNGVYSIGIYAGTSMIKKDEYDVLYLTIDNQNTNSDIISYPSEHKGFWEIEVF